MTESYEAMKQDPILPEDVRRQWVEADGAERMYRYNVDKIESDPDLTDDAKHRKLLDLYADQAPRIEDKKRAARQALLKAAEAAEKNSWPRVKGATLDPGDASDLIAAQNVENAVVADYRELKKKADANKLPFAPDTADYLRARYKAGLETGGVAGTALVRGVIGAANRLGVSVEEVVGPLRSQREVEALERAQRLMSMSDVISTKVSLPRSVQRRRRRPGRMNERRGQGAAILVPGGGGQPIAKPAPESGASRAKRAARKRKSAS